MQVCSVSPPTQIQCGLKRPFEPEELNYRTLLPSFGETFQLIWEPHLILPPSREILGKPLRDRAWVLTNYHHFAPDSSSSPWMQQWTLILISPRKGTLQTPAPAVSAVSLEENWTLVLTREPLKTPTGDFSGAVFSTRVWLGWKNQAEPRKWSMQTWTVLELETTPVKKVKHFTPGKFQRLILKGYYPSASPQTFNKEDLGVFNWLVQEGLEFDVLNIEYSGPEEDLKPTSREFGERRVEKRSWDSPVMPRTSWKITVLVIPPQ